MYQLSDEPFYYTFYFGKISITALAVDKKMQQIYLIKDSKSHEDDAGIKSSDTRINLNAFQFGSLEIVFFILKIFIY